jgi:hypothetical protein
MLTMKYFEFLAGFQGSVVPQCSPGNRNVPHPTRVQNYTSASEDLQYLLGYVGVDGRGFSEHSMKRGGATEAARYKTELVPLNFPLFRKLTGSFNDFFRCGATREEIQVAGHWASAQTVEKYIEASQVRQRHFHQYFANGN